MDFFLPAAIYALLGCVAGLTAGLLGIGGGLIIVPVLMALFAAQGFSADIVMQLALGTSLATIVFTSLSSMYAHHRRGAVNWSVMWQLSAGIFTGGWLSGMLAVWLGGPLLAVVFGVFELLVAMQMLFGQQARPHQAQLRLFRNLVAGAVIGIVSALLGIGGGTLTVPWLVWHRIDMRTAIGTASACGFPIALAGAAGFVLAGLDNTRLPPDSSGFVYWPAVAAISVTSMLCAPLGARLAHRIRRQHLRTIFAVFLLAMGIWMIIGQHTSMHPG